MQWLAAVGLRERPLAPGAFVYVGGLIRPPPSQNVVFSEHIIALVGFMLFVDPEISR